MSEAAEIVVQVEVPSPEVPPAPSTSGETAPTVAASELLTLAATVGTLTAKVEALESKALETEQAAESAQVTADVALTVAASTPAPEPEPESEPEVTVTEVTVPSSSAGADGPAKTPATARPWLARMLLG